jgi:hypothetical protein
MAFKISPIWLSLRQPPSPRLRRRCLLKNNIGFSIFFSYFFNVHRAAGFRFFVSLFSFQKTELSGEKTIWDSGFSLPLLISISGRRSIEESRIPKLKLTNFCLAIIKNPIFLPLRRISKTY